MLGERLADLDLPADPMRRRPRVGQGGGAAVRPLRRLRRACSGPEMRSTGEVMGIAADFPTAFAKAQAAAGSPLPTSGTVFITVTDGDKPRRRRPRRPLHDLGFRDRRDAGTAQAIRADGRARRARSTRSARAPRTWSTGSSAARSTSSSTRRPAPARAPTAGRSAGPRSRAGSRASRRCRGLAAARAIAAAADAASPVSSLQEIHRERLRCRAAPTTLVSGIEVARNPCK